VQQDLREVEQTLCVWDGTYTAPEAEREAMDQVPGWNHDAPPTPERRRAKPGETPRDRRRTLPYLNAA
jgi:hypothetical protein